MFASSAFKKQQLNCTIERVLNWLFVALQLKKILCTSVPGKKPGVNFIKALRAAFAPIDPKSVKRYWQLDCILTLLGAKAVKAVCKYVGEIEPRGQFHQSSMSSLLVPRSQKRKKDWQLYCHFCAFVICECKSCS